MEGMGSCSWECAAEIAEGSPGIISFRTRLKENVEIVSEPVSVFLSSLSLLLFFSISNCAFHVEKKCIPR